MLVLEKSFFGEKKLLVLPPGCTLFVTLRQLASGVKSILKLYLSKSIVTHGKTTRSKVESID